MRKWEEPGDKGFTTENTERTETLRGFTAEGAENAKFLR
jgi:hypothetical protein